MTNYVRELRVRLQLRNAGHEVPSISETNFTFILSPAKPDQHLAKPLATLPGLARRRALLCRARGMEGCGLLQTLFAAVRVLTNSDCERQ